MQKPLLPSNELVRLANLQSLGILDTPAEARFDRYTRLAHQVFNMPIALISLVDANRQWFKSKVGLEANETHRDFSFCGHSILHDKLFIINDASRDPRFADNPLVNGEPHVIFYAGCPIAYPDGTLLGTLCVIDHKPRRFGAKQQQILQDLASCVQQELIVMQMATMDELTQLPNRRGFLGLAQQVLSLSCRAQQPCTLTFIDLNQFKEINDKFGHCEGDNALRAFASLLQQHCRSSDVVARLGGDEFVILTANTTEAESRRALNRLYATVRQFNQSRTLPYPLQFCAGTTAIAPAAQHNIDALLERADRKMYQQKRTLTAENG
ncbi:sensor domain-containing diguanylate cyclase [uncultured Ferrimonas sp.]|uniref:sensor domain-containing diguanylate cyclase n=1 Tax=uncultured Ferrimonas sp. TaxID=432640 RepID=UPI0026083AB2|nr:sensor domain-containing diguanylate cyclase [uncultured Ferrimonas sp.]